MDDQDRMPGVETRARGRRFGRAPSSKGLDPARVCSAVFTVIDVVDVLATPNGNRGAMPSPCRDVSDPDVAPAIVDREEELACAYCKVATAGWSRKIVEFDEEGWPAA
jgi:hypothetical protein